MSALHDYAFYNCEKLASIDFPSSLRYLGVNVFKDCTSLNTVNMQQLFNVPEIVSIEDVNNIC